MVILRFINLYLVAEGLVKEKQTKLISLNNFKNLQKMLTHLKILAVTYCVSNGDIEENNRVVWVFFLEGHDSTC